MEITVKENKVITTFEELEIGELFMTDTGELMVKLPEGFLDSDGCGVNTYEVGSYWYGDYFLKDKTVTKVKKVEVMV